MAIRGAVRWRPDVGRSASQSSILNLIPSPRDADGNATGGHPSGTIVMIAQLVAFDDARIGGPNPYRPGSPDTEREVTILYEQVFTKELAVLGQMTEAQATSEWTATLQGFRDEHLPAVCPLIKAIRAARMSPPIVI